MSFGALHIRLRLLGEGGGVWTLRTGSNGATLTVGEGDGEPTLEVIAEADVLWSVLDGRTDGRTAVHEGGIRVSGDIAAVKRLAAALGTYTPH
jgi:ubiquinone biosynthesis protein UbiJ